MPAWWGKVGRELDEVAPFEPGDHDVKWIAGVDDNNGF